MTTINTTNATAITPATIRFMDISYGNMREIFPKTNQEVSEGKDLEAVAKTFGDELKDMGLLEEVFRCLEVLEEWNGRERQLRGWSSPAMYGDGRYYIVALLCHEEDEGFFMFSSLEQFLTTIARDKKTLLKWKKVFAKRDAEDN